MKRTFVATIAILALVVGMCLVVAGGAVADRDRYDLTGVWTGTFENGAVPPAPVTFDLTDTGTVTGEIYQTTGYDEGTGEFNVEVNYGPGCCTFEEIGDTLRYQSTMLIQGKTNHPSGENFDHALTMTTHDAPGQPDSQLDIWQEGDTLIMEGTVYFVLHSKTWIYIWPIWWPINVDETSDIGTIHLEKPVSGRDSDPPSRQAMEGYWEGQGTSDNPDGGYELDIPVASQVGDRFQVQDALMASTPAGPPMFGDDWTMTMHEAEGTESGGNVAINLVVPIVNYEGELTTIRVDFAGTMTSPTHVEGTYAAEADVIFLGIPYTVTLDGGAYTSDMVDIVIDRLVPAAGQVGSTVTINGSEFGDDYTNIHSGDYSWVTLNETVMMEVVTWSDTQITVIVPPSLGTHDVVVHRRGVESNAVPFTSTLPPSPYNACAIGGELYP